MTIIKQHTSPDGYECQLLESKGKKRGKWRIRVAGEWMSLTDIAAIYPGLTTDMLSHRCRARLEIFPTSVRFVQNMKIRFRGRTPKGKPFCLSMYPADWAEEWATMRGVTLSQAIRRAFVAHLGRELKACPQDAEGALKRTLKGFSTHSEKIA